MELRGMISFKTLLVLNSSIFNYLRKINKVNIHMSILV
jgi:hypothetical protein